MRKKQPHLKAVCASLVLAFFAQVATTQHAQANPIGAAVVNGQANFAASGNTLTVTNTPNTIINWQGFSIGAGEITRFAQQSASSAVLNRVIANNPSQILGSLQSNGRVFLVNPSGIVFGAGATVNVAGMVASTLNLSNEDFLAGRYNFANVPGAQNISNAGNITAQNGGQIYLIAPNVENTGIVNAPGGEILLAAGHSVELVNSNDPNLRVNITAPAGDATNVGQLVASSGSLGLFGAVVKNTGTVSANSATMQGGKIVFRASQRVEAGGIISAQGMGGGTINVFADMQAGTVNVTGTLDASSLPSPAGGRGAGGEGVSGANGGFIETSAAHVNVADTARITTAATDGKSGIWLIDPFDFTIAATGGNMTGAALTTNLAGGNISILSTTGTTGTAGDINVNDTVTWSANKLTLNAQNNININANLNGSGTASLALEYGQQAVAAGNTSTYNVKAAVNLSAGSNFSTKLGSDGAVKNYTVITSLGVAGSTTTTDLQGMNGGLALNYALGGNIDAAGTSAWNTNAGFTPVGNATTQFTGKFDGLGHTISNLTINRPSTDYVGLFGYTGAGSVIRSVGLVGGSVSGLGSVGELVGFNSGTISNSYTTGNVIGSGYIVGTGYIGGLVGHNSGTVSNSYAAGSVSGLGAVGGLVGEHFNGGTVSNSYATGSVTGTESWVGGLMGVNHSTVSNSYATGSVSGTGNYVGGLVGENQWGSVSNSYATGNVSGASYVGGLVGWNFDNTISNSYATGSVSGTTNVGGLVGVNGGSVTNSFWNTTTSGRATSAGGTGLTTAQMMQLSSFTSWNTATPNTIANTGGSGATWRIYEGSTAPLLASFLTPLTATANAATKTYDGAAYTGGNGVTYSTTPNGNLLGAVSYSGTSQGATNAGSYAITPSALYSNQQGYDISYVNGTLTVNKAPLTVATNATSKTYDGLAYTGGNGVIYSGFVNSESTGVLGGTLAYGGTSQGAINAGSYLITPGGLTSSNYTLSYVDSTLTVNRASLAAAITGTPAKVYDGSTAATLSTSNYSLTGFVGSESAIVGQTAGTYNSKDVATASTINAALAANNFTGTGSTLLANYFLPTSAAGAGSITAAALTVTANALNKTAGNADPLLTYMTAGLKPPDTTTSTLSGALARLAGETAGLYPVNQGSLTSLSSNYTLSYVPADFGIVAVPVVLTPTVMDTLVNSITVIPPSAPVNPPTSPVLMQAQTTAPADQSPADTNSPEGDKKDAQSVVVTDATAPSVAPIAAAPLPVCQ